MRVLVIRLSAMGDVAMTVHALLAVKRAHPYVRFFMLSRKRFQPIFGQVPDLQFISADEGGIEKGFSGLIQLAYRLRKMHFDRVVDLHDVLRSKVIRKLAGVRASNLGVIDKGRKLKRLHIKNSERDVYLLSTHERYLDAFAKANLPTSFIKEDVLHPEPLDAMLSTELQVRAGEYLVFAPFAAHASKSLSPGKADSFLRELMHTGRRILLLGGGQQEVIMLNKLAEGKSGVASIAGRFTFYRELQLISNAHAVIAMDSGNGHLAALYGVPVITIWGATHPSLGFAPYGQPVENGLYPNYNRFTDLPDTIYGKGSGYGHEVTETIDFSTLSRTLEY